MQNWLFDELYSKRLKKHYFIFAISCVAFMAVIYTPAYLLLSSNVLWRNSVLLFLLTELISPLMNFVFYWGSFAYLIYAYLRFGKSENKPLWGMYAAAVVARYLLTMLVSFTVMSFPSWKSFWSDELSGVLFSTLMDCLQVFAVLLLCEYRCRRPLSNDRISIKGGESLISECLPVSGLLELKKPLPQLCFFSALIPAGLQLLSRLYYDLFFWGLPTGASEWLLMATYYFGDLAAIVVGYLVLLYLLQTVYTDEIRCRARFNS